MARTSKHRISDNMDNVLTSVGKTIKNMKFHKNRLENVVKIVKIPKNRKYLYMGAMEKRGLTYTMFCHRS